MTIITATEDIPPANSRSITFNLAAEHYEQGMRVDFNVTGTSNEPPSTPESTAAPTEAPTQAPAKP